MTVNVHKENERPEMKTVPDERTPAVNYPTYPEAVMHIILLQLDWIHHVLLCLLPVGCWGFPYEEELVV
ncbi:hypothetical protein EK904_007449 [Melospiza melodia maxima]|nr:hypothetical protein EK904_007449 [Melospiza melodia maxima]